MGRNDIKSLVKTILCVTDVERKPFNRNRKRHLSLLTILLGFLGRCETGLKTNNPHEIDLWFCLKTIQTFTTCFTRLSRTVWDGLKDRRRPWPGPWRCYQWSTTEGDFQETTVIHYRLTILSEETNTSIPVRTYCSRPFSPSSVTTGCCQAQLICSQQPAVTQCLCSTRLEFCLNTCMQCLRLSIANPLQGVYPAQTSTSTM